MGRTREIKKRTVAVGNIQRITKTMQMIATVKFTAAMQRAMATRPYTAKVQELVREVAAAAGDVPHPLLSAPARPAQRELMLVITSDRGFCGAYNNNVLRAAMAHVRGLKDAGRASTLEVSGKKGAGYFKFQRLPLEERYTIGDKPAYADVERIAQKYIDAFIEGKYDAVRVAFMKFLSSSRQVPQVQCLLPMEPAAGAEDQKRPAAVYEYSPSSTDLLDDLLPRAVKTALFQAFNDAVVSEQLMKMVAMKAATENARDIGRLLRRQYNRARQTQITTELMEVIGGAAALE